MNDYISREAAKKEIVEFWEVMPELKHCKENQLKRIDRVPAADVRQAEEISDATDEAIRVLNYIHSSGRLDYSDYCELYDLINAICYDCGARMDGGDAK